MTQPTSQRGTMDYLHAQTTQNLTTDYLIKIKDYTSKSRSCADTVVTLILISGIFTGLGSILAFAAPYYATQYMSFAAGCAGVIAMICLKATYVANSQSQFFKAEVKNLLTTEYQFLNQFYEKPLSLKPLPEPPLGEVDLDQSPDADRKSKRH